MHMFPIPSCSIINWEINATINDIDQFVIVIVEVFFNIFDA